MRISLSAAQRLTLLLILAAQCRKLLHARVEPSYGFDMFSAQEEVQAGQQAAAQVGKQVPLLPDSDPVTLYVHGWALKLAATLRREMPYTFHVVNQKEINAFALPGGQFLKLGPFRRRTTKLSWQS